MRSLTSLLLCAAVACVPAAAADAGDSGDPPEADDARAGATVSQSLQGRDGVRIQTMCTHCNSANIQVGGLAEDLVPVLRDGYPVFGGLATSVVLSVLPAGAIVDTQVAKGPGDTNAPAAAAGGVLRLTEATALELPRIDAEVDGGSYDLLGGHVRAAGGAGKDVGWRLTAGSAEADPVDDDGDGHIDVGALDRRFAEGRFTWDVADDHALDVGVSWIDEDTTEARGAFDVFGVLFSPDPDPSAAWTREDAFVERTEARAGWTWELDQGRTFDLRLLQADRDQTVRSQLTGDPDGPLGPEATTLFDRFQIAERHRWAGATYAHPIGFDWMLQFGVDGHEQRVRAETLELFDLIGGGPTPEPEIGTDYLETLSAYAEADWAMSARWSVSAGLRYEDMAWGAVEDSIRREASQVSPRVNLRFKPTPGWTLRLLAGRTARPPKPILAEVCCGQSYQRSVNADAERGTTWGFEGIFQPGPGFRASVYTARTTFDDHLIRVVGWSQVYTQTYTLGNVAEARADTLEAAVRWSPHSRLQLDASIGWLAFFNTGEEDVPVRVTPPSFGAPVEVLIPMERIPYRPLRTGSLSAAWRVGRGVALTASANYTGEMLIQQFDEDPTASQNILLPDPRRTSAFWLFGVSAQVPVHPTVEIIAGLDNLTNEIQSDLGDPTTDYNWGPLSGRSWRLGLRWHLDR